MNVYLVQHGESKSKEEDPERSLTEIGQAEVGKMATHAAEYIDINVKTVAHSGKTRAEQTADVFYEHLSSSEAIAAVKDLDPMADPSIWAERLKLMKDDIMLVGHLPHLAKLTSLLLCGDESKPVVAFQNAGIVCLQRDDEDNWSLRWAVTPEVV